MPDLPFLLNLSPIYLLLIANSLLLVMLSIFLIRGGAGRRHELDAALRDSSRELRADYADTGRSLREELRAGHESSVHNLVRTLSGISQTQQVSLDGIKRELGGFSETLRGEQERLRTAVNQQLQAMQKGNESKLEEMRRTVDEKLQGTLEKRLGESFKLVSERLEAVQRGLGEMQQLATGVGDLKRVLTNVKSRGAWGEVQLAALLEQIMTPDQYAKNVKTRPASNELVEFAVRLPGPEDEPDSVVWLPIDSKFPQEDYLRLSEAADRADADGVRVARDALVRAIKKAAQDVRDKYLEPPHTTDFAILFLPTEGLYSEVLRQAGVVEELQHKYRVVIAGPTSLSAILSSLRLGFRTLAIEQRSAEVWRILAAVKTEFGKFGDVLDKLKKQLNSASNTVNAAETRTRQMNRKLKAVESMPLTRSERVLDLEELVQEFAAEEMEPGE